MDTRTLEQEIVEGPCLEQLQTIDTGWGPKVESAMLIDLLKRSLGLAQGLTDPTEVPNDSNPHARLNAYKHRLHALRCEYADARVRGIELEEQLAEANLRILRLEARVKHLDGTLEQIYATRLWKVKERCARCWRAVSRWLPRRGRSQTEAAPLPDDHGSNG
ncbi:MAG TPA: hypothetical protein VMG10_23145 [Gemmataceae bacterium]|nr:hypothetical protein [Gemmataceae bacterium]